MNVGIIIGHDQKAKGAVTYNGISEYDFNSYVADCIYKLHVFKFQNKISKIQNLKVINRNLGWSDVEKQLRGCDLSLELHLNSFEKVANGTETLYIENDLVSYDFAKNLSFNISIRLGTNIRGKSGTLGIKEGGRGFNNLNTAKKAGVKIAALVEPCFVNYQTKEAEYLINNPLEYASILYATLEDYNKHLKVS